jgi:demethylmenaquinone methyltransferase / 2-methoxy-6-polyprenyl-1,4-benzoquinol methylase
VEPALGEATRAARSLFAPLGPTYDRYARVLSFGQDPRWRSFLVSRVDAAPDQRVLDVASGTGAVAIELARRYGCSVVGIDQSAEMLAAGRRRVAAADVGELVRLEQGQAESLPFEDESFDAVTFTYLLRYVDDPAATLRELARVLRPGGRLASLEFFVPPNPLARAAWELYVRVGLPLAGSVVSPGWGRVGRFLGPSIRGFYERVPLPMLLGLWRAAGIGEPRFRSLSLGGGIVVWGDREG